MEMRDYYSTDYAFGFIWRGEKTFILVPESEDWHIGDEVRIIEATETGCRRVVVAVVTFRMDIAGGSVLSIRELRRREVGPQP